MRQPKPKSRLRMKYRKQESVTRSTPQTRPPSLTLAHFLGILLATIVVSALLYSPALHGRFIFDDDALPFRQGIRNGPLLAWISGVRPVLMFTYWINYHLSAGDPYSYHCVNLLIHAINTYLVFVVLLRVLSLADWCRTKCDTAAILGATVFLIHPLATESVSYIAGRSESLAALFMLLAYVVFLHGYSAPITWLRSILVLTFFALAVATKENAAALAGLLVLTDLFWPRPFSLQGVRRNYRIYLLMLPGIPLVVRWVARTLSGAETAGFSIKEFTWYQYAFSQVRAIFEYIRLAIFPIGQSVDHDFPISQTLTSHGTIYFLFLIAVLIAAALHFRLRYPLACFGLLFYLILLAPTSSVIPIADPLVERRLYLPMLGLILIACEAAKHARWSTGSVALVAAILIVFSTLCYQRNRLWGKPERVWALAAQNSRGKGRPYLGLAESLIAVKRCSEAIPYLERGERLMPRDFTIQLAWGKVLECQGEQQNAVNRLERAATLSQNSTVFQLIGLLYGEMGKSAESGVALHKATLLGPRNAAAHSAMGLWYEAMSDAIDAEREYRESLAIDAYNTEGVAGLGRIQRLTATRPPVAPSPTSTP